MPTKFFFAALAFVLLAGIALPQTPVPAKHHAIFQMTEPENNEWGALMAHVINLRKAFENDGGVEVEVVFFGPGLSMLYKATSPYGDLLKQLADQGVKLTACQNSMRDRRIKTEDLFPFASQVDAGVAELVRKQEAGWAYIK
jgi:intracellular sulfur oxidation DsrE/DsrF family protein